MKKLRLRKNLQLAVRTMIDAETCGSSTVAAETTFGEYAQNAGLTFVEASSVLQMIARNKVMGESDPFRLAKATLDQFGNDLVARKTIQLYSASDSGLVISGFRTIEELELIKRHITHAQVVLLKQPNVHVTSVTLSEEDTKRSGPLKNFERTMFSNGRSSFSGWLKTSLTSKLSTRVQRRNIAPE
jgi:hypothetical protein